MHREGYLMIGDQAYGNKEVIEKAKLSRQSMEKYGKELPPLNYPTVKPNTVEKSKWREVYPDVTNQYKKQLAIIKLDIEKRIKSAGFLKLPNAAEFFLSKFRNNLEYDLQVNHGLPGQVLEWAPDHNLILPDPKDPLFPKTQDQWAMFEGVPRPAGFFSNFAFGYAVAVFGLPKETVLWGNKLINPSTPDNHPDVLYGYQGFDYFKSEK
jgi:hypothetical protein